MDKRTREYKQQMADQAAQQASEAGRTLQAHQQTISESDGGERLPAHRTEADEPPDTKVRPKPRNDDRDNAMAEIEARDLKSKGIESKAATSPESAAPLEQTPTATGEGSPLPEPAPAAAAEPTKTVRVKVDGEEFDAPQADVDEAGGIKAYQQTRASENRLRKANETLAATRQTQAQIAAWIQSQTPKEPVKTDAQFIQEKMDTIRFGEPAEAAAAMSEVISRGRPNIDQNQIISKAVAAMQQQTAENQFVTEFSDIVHNPLLLKLIIGMKNERLSQLTAAPDWSNFYRSIGNEVRGAIGRQSQPATPAAAATAAASGNTSQPDREARKASIVNLPTAAARAALPEATKPESREDILNEMRKSRGIPTG